MSKVRKNLVISLMSLGLIIGNSISASAAEYNYSSSEFKNYVNINNGKTFTLVGTQSISKGSQAPKTSGNPCGVQYQILKSGSIVKYVTRTGTYSRTLSVDLNNSNATGSCIVRLMNYYSSSYIQTASGKFNY